VLKFKSYTNDKQSLNKSILLSLFVLFLDQIIKFLVVSEIIDMEFSKNSGILFGVQPDANFVFVFFAIFLFIAILSFKKKFKSDIFLLLFRRSFSAEDSEELSAFSSQFSAEKLRRGKITIMAFCLIFGGIISNLSDRVLYGHIIDYINLFNLFSFNIADLAICFGALILGWRILGK